MTSSLAVAVAQFAPTDDTARNLAQIERLARLAVDRGAEVVLFGETCHWFTPDITERWLEHAEPLDGPFVTALSRLADELGVHLVAGMIERLPDPSQRVGNTVVAIAPQAGLVASYRKVHLYDAFGGSESTWIAPGELTDPQVFDVKGFTVGLQTCYDLRFCEITRWLVDAGAQIVLMPACWVRGRLKEGHWRTLIRARAIENTIWFAAADHPPGLAVGHSMIVDPLGVELATIGDVDGDIALAWLESTRLTQVREQNPSLALRRFEVVPKVSGDPTAAAPR